MNSFQLYFQLGLSHILSWSSVDHILFLTALILVFSLKQWRELLTLVSLFTVAHTTSLLLSVYGILKVDENLIEKLILCTILITALSNVFIRNKKFLGQMHYYFSFVFGLVHGLGFATDFKMIIAGQSQKLLPLLEFALGIETAQIILGLIILTAGMVMTGVLKIKEREYVLFVSALITGYVFSLVVYS